MSAATALAISAVLLGSGCTSVSKDGCRDDADCPAGVCLLGQCRPVTVVDLSGPDRGVPADLRSPGMASDLSGLCNFNGDGIITRDEAPFTIGLGGLYAVNPPDRPVPVNLAKGPGGWDFSASAQGDHKVFDQIIAPTGMWWAAHFPGATHAQRIDDAQDLLGVYRVTDSELLLLGVVSQADGLTRTLLTYATPVPVLRFPLQMGTSWTANSGVSGQAMGVPLLATESYSFAVTDRADTKVPLGTFDTLRLRLDYRQLYGVLLTTRITYLHLAECYGLVARVRSKDNEQSADFTQAAEYRRLVTP